MLFTIIDTSEIPAYNFNGDMIAYLQDYNFVSSRSVASSSLL